jgi:hypothetical protein
MSEPLEPDEPQIWGDEGRNTDPPYTSAAALSEHEALVNLILERIEEWEARRGPYKHSAYVIVLRAYREWKEKRK